MSTKPMSDYTREHYTERLAGISAQLHELADRVIQEGTPRGSDPAAYMAAVAAVQHTLTWGIANLHSDALARLVSDLTVALDVEREG